MTAIKRWPKCVEFVMTSPHKIACPADRDLHVVCECGKEEATDALVAIARALDLDSGSEGTGA